MRPRPGRNTFILIFHKGEGRPIWVVRFGLKTGDEGNGKTRGIGRRRDNGREKIQKAKKERDK
jgi:hypothetical protein